MEIENNFNCKFEVFFKKKVSKIKNYSIKFKRKVTNIEYNFFHVILKKFIILYYNNVLNNYNN